jgi:hypothetical protein
MRLVDRKQRDVGLSQQGQAARRQQPLRRDVEQVEVAGEQPPLDLRGFAKRQRRVQHRRVDAGLQQSRDLVAHQRDQRRHHDAAAFAQQGRQLVTQRLAAAGRHQHQAVAAIGHVADDFLLRAAKSRQAEHGIQHRQRIRNTVAVKGGGSRHGDYFVRSRFARRRSCGRKSRLTLIMARPVQIRHSHQCAAVRAPCRPDLR